MAISKKYKPGTIVVYNLDETVKWVVAPFEEAKLQESFLIGLADDRLRVRVKTNQGRDLGYVREDQVIGILNRKEKPSWL